MVFGAISLLLRSGPVLPVAFIEAGEKRSSLLCGASRKVYFFTIRK
jgi:hypothetical protein